MKSKRQFSTLPQDRNPEDGGRGQKFRSHLRMEMTSSDAADSSVRLPFFLSEKSTEHYGCCLGAFNSRTGFH